MRQRDRVSGGGRLAVGWRRDGGYGGVGKIVGEDFAEGGAGAGHGGGAALAEADAVALAYSFEEDLGVVVFVFGARSEIVAGDGVPAEAAVDGEAAGFAFGEDGGVFGRDAASPADGIFVADVAEDGEVGIRLGGQAEFGGSAGAAAATAGEHGGDGLFAVGDYEALCGGGRLGGGGAGAGRFAEGLAVG